MAVDRRILFVPQSPLTASAESFLNRESIAVLSTGDIDELSSQGPLDLLIVDTRQVSGDVLETCAARAGAKVLGIGVGRPTDDVLELVEAFLIEPFSQGELIGAIGDLLDMRLRRALRIGVEIPTVMRRDGTPAIDGTLLQLSETGCLLESDSPIRVGQEVSISFVLPSNREEIQIEATIVSTNELQLIYGLKWSDGFEAERLAILVFVELGLAAGASSAPRGGDASSIAVSPA